MKVERTFQVGGIKLELVDFFKPGEVFIEGTVMLERARKAGAILKQDLAKKLLENKCDIPKELGEFDIVLAGVKVKLGGSKIKMIPYIHKQGNNWVWACGGFKYDWHRQARLVRLCS